MPVPLSLYSSKTYTDIFILSIARCPNSGVVAKPGIATGSRSDKRANYSERRRRRDPWVKGSIDCGNRHVRTDPFGPTNLIHSDLSFLGGLHFFDRLEDII